MAGLISRLRRLRHSDQAVAAHVRETLTQSLYASPQSLVIGAVTSSVIVVLVAMISGRAAMLACALAILVVAGIRIVDALRFLPLLSKDRASCFGGKRQELGSGPINRIPLAARM